MGGLGSMAADHAAALEKQSEQAPAWHFTGYAMVCSSGGCMDHVWVEEAPVSSLFWPVMLPGFIEGIGGSILCRGSVTLYSDFQVPGCCLEPNQHCVHCDVPEDLDVMKQLMQRRSLEDGTVQLQNDVHADAGAVRSAVLYW